MAYDFTNVGINDATGAEVFLRSLMMGGASKGASGPLLGPVTLPGRATALYVASGTLLALATHFGPLLRYAGAGAGFWTLPTNYMLGYTRIPGTTQELLAYYQRNFLGSLSLTQSQYRGEVASQAAMLLLSSAVQGDWCQRTDLNPGGTRGGQVAILTGTTFSTLGHWTILPHNTANRPNIAWGAVANQGVMVALSGALVGDFCTRTDDSASCYQLITSPYSTPGNWLKRTDTLTQSPLPVNPAIRVVWNGQDPSTLPDRHPAPLLMSDGIGNDDWTAS